jgi:hypothetical protein
VLLIESRLAGTLLPKSGLTVSRLAGTLLPESGLTVSRLTRTLLTRTLPRVSARPVRVAGGSQPLDRWFSPVARLFSRVVRHIGLGRSGPGKPAA